MLLIQAWLRAQSLRIGRCPSAAQMVQTGLAHTHAVVVRNLSFSYTPHVPGSEVLERVSFKVPWGARVVLVGLNGAGKSSLLSLIAGARMAPEGVVTVLGEDAFRGAAASKRVVLISSEWTAAVATMSSASADEMMAAAVERACEEERAETAERGRRLAKLLGVDDKWQVYALSEGQRRRLHLVIKLMPLYQVALLDEATTDLDIVARRNLLLFLRHDSGARRATVFYCTHIFDGLEGWASHLALVDARRVSRLENCRAIPALAQAAPFGAGVQPLTNMSQAAMLSSTQDPAAESSSMYDVVRTWLQTHTASDPSASLSALPRALQGAGGTSVAVSVDNLSWGWGAGAGVGGKGKLVLRDLNCEIPAGSRVVLAGLPLSPSLSTHPSLPLTFCRLGRSQRRRQNELAQHLRGSSYYLAPGVSSRVRVQGLRRLPLPEQARARARAHTHTHNTLSRTRTLESLSRTRTRDRHSLTHTHTHTHTNSLLDRHAVILSQEWRQTLRCVNSGGYTSFEDASTGLITNLVDDGFDEAEMRARLGVYV